MKNTLFFNLLALFATSLILPVSAVHAENWSDKVTLKGFMSSTYQRTNVTQPFNGEANESGIDNKGSLKGTKLGINITSKINDRVMLASQLFASAEENYAMVLDWAFIGLNLTDTLTLRMGKVKFPVGLVNEYRDVGFATPWIQAPEVVYSLEVPNGPQATREAYSGSSFLWQKSYGDMAYTVDLFGGEASISDGDVRQLRGITVQADWDDKVLLQASSYNGIMANATTTPTMNGQKQDVSTFGVKVDWNDYIFYAETADVKIGSLAARRAKSSYATFGHRFGKFLPHFTIQKLEQGQVTDDQTISRLGLRYELFPDTALKFEVGTIKTDKGQGLFDGAPSNSSVNIYGFSVDIIY